MTNRVEDTFIKLAQKWQYKIKGTPIDMSVDRETDLISLACLLLVAEYDEILPANVDEVIIENRKSAIAHWSITVYAMSEAMVWSLCLKDTPQIASRSNTILRVLDFLDAPDSSMRKWAMDIGWIIRSWLDVDQAVPRLLNNIANTLGYIRESFALAWNYAGEMKEWKNL